MYDANLTFVLLIIKSEERLVNESSIRETQKKRSDNVCPNLWLSFHSQAYQPQQAAIVKLADILLSLVSLSTTRHL